MPAYIGRALTALSLIGVSAYIWFASEEFPANGHQLPQFTSGIAILLAIFLLIDAFRNGDRTEKVEFDFSFASKKQFVVLLLAVIYVPVMFEVGYFVTSFIFLVSAMLISGVRSPKTIAVTVVVTLPLMYAFFTLFLNAQLPDGWFF